VDYDGSATGGQLGVMLQPVSLLEGIHGILLAGGGPMGLAAVPGAVKYLDENHIGYDWGVPNIRIPIVVGAVIDDLPIGDGRIRPDAEAGYKACQAASAGPVAEGNVGAGAGASVLGDERGLATELRYSMRLVPCTQHAHRFHLHMLQEQENITSWAKLTLMGESVA
jgi:L-aminopeptidase/D-esterase-like protein